MKNYEIVSNEGELKKFIEWLPELKSHETFYLCLFARSKYCKGISHIKSDKAQLKRFTSDKDRLFNKIKQLECPVGSYTAKKVGGGLIAAPQESLALYITVTPRNLKLATQNTLHKLIDLSTQPYNGYNPHAEIMSEIQKAKSKTRVTSFDFDLEDDSVFKTIFMEVVKIVNAEALDVVKTRGGYHFIITPTKVKKEFVTTWHLAMEKILFKYSSDKDNFGDIMLPVPGTYQGGFSPYFISS